MSLSIVFICLALVVGIYFYNNPLKHGPWFLSRRFINWFPLGMTYAFLYMGRYNLTVAKNALGSLMSNEDFGLIFAAGTITYAFSFLINGPLVDKIGGKKGILIAALGAAAANVALGVITWLVLTNRIHMRLLPIFSVTYALNMYFQSYGAVSIIKVTKRNAPMPTSAVEHLLRAIFVPPGLTTDATWAVFFVPAAILAVWALLDIWLIRDTPEHAGFPHLDTHDASSGHMHEEYGAIDLLKMVFLNPLIVMFAFVELTADVLRNGIMQWYTIFGHDVKQPGAAVILANW